MSKAVEGISLTPKKHLIAPAAAVYSHVAKVNRGTIVLYFRPGPERPLPARSLARAISRYKLKQVFRPISRLAVEAAGGRDGPISSS